MVNRIIFFKLWQLYEEMLKSVETVKYTDCISAEELDSLNECPGYDT